MMPPKSGWIRGSRIISVGYGFQNKDLQRLGKLKNTDTYSISSIMIYAPVYAKWEIYVLDYLGICAALNFNTITYDHDYYTYNFGTTKRRTHVKYDIFGLNVRFNYHILYEESIDLYIGGGTGLRISRGSVSVNGMPDLLPGGFFREAELTMGLRYLGLDGFGIYMEAGLGRSVLQAGLSYNLKN